MSNVTLKGLVLAGTCLFSSLLLAENGIDLSQSPEVSAGNDVLITAPKQQERMVLNYVNQPPMIPHSIDGYQVTQHTNTCLKCHGVQSSLSAKAPRISPTHFTDAQGQVLTDVAPRRYFCIACHVAQTDVAPIIENEFKPAVGFGQ